MNRRNFIKTGILATTGIALFNSIFINCSDNSFSLKDIIGQKEEILTGFPREGDRDFSYYIVENFKEGFIKGEEVFIFCTDRKITGYTIKMKGSEMVEKIIEELDKSQNKKQSFSNDFGKEYQWVSENKKITLCYSKPYLNMLEFTFYSESEISPDSKLIII